MALPVCIPAVNSGGGGGEQPVAAAVVAASAAADVGPAERLAAADRIAFEFVMGPDDVPFMRLALSDQVNRMIMSATTMMLTVATIV